ncbi:5-oxoprolinase subunit PxpB [Lentilactobacillus farraginis]|uniref:Allophanate hydrolase 2 subunit 1 n=1 Tax=Lentilactobacillus farraginis DSM 18382 = JCM 14108 TaxID=1423743 RepID=X0PC95_9LACO|nr:5-oxoprolinase subunit PxpB [Lentilactobacillus farraginis]KRM13099.1 TIGR00370 family protein [Lentilactobacillus farraginis DSM 18382 = JCM 14108]GAF37903.1 allophanate hydrolase 2 subunit 1 [Lentilactobacillus farraginis DSM 18382 = JCM 14108]
MTVYRIIPVGDQALSIEFANKIDAQVNRRIQSLGKTILAAQLTGVQAVIPAYHTLMVTFDGLNQTYKQLVQELQPIIDVGIAAPLPLQRILKIPVCYESPFNPDLADVAEFAGTTTQEVIRLHTQQPYLIYFLGFLPGFAYMASVVDKIAMPRLTKPRVEIPAGSVGIAGIQTGFYPVTSPGGWRLIGQTPLTLYDADHPEPFYHAGDLVQFEPISKTQFEKIKAADQAGRYKVKVVQKNA